MATERRTGEDNDRDPSAGWGATQQGPAREQDVEEEVSWITWQSTLYLFVLCVACVFLASRTTLWWIVPVLGAATPLALAILDRLVPELRGPGGKGAKERELMVTLAGWGEVTPAAAAMRTSLTVEEAAKMLDELAGKGHLKLRTEGGIMVYSLPGRNRPPASAGVPVSVGPQAGKAAPSEQPGDPLSERELEVLALLASGRTNAEISGDLFVAVGTVKSHLNSIYRKLGAVNRAEAVTKARESNLLR